MKITSTRISYQNSLTIIQNFMGKRGDDQVDIESNMIIGRIMCFLKIALRNVQLTKTPEYTESFLIVSVYR